MSRKHATERQSAILRFIVQYIESHGFPPSLQEIANAMNIKTLRGVSVQLHALECKGYIRLHHVARGIQILREPNEN